jgi:hypothetical protein
MARSVNITTPIPTLEELGERLGLSKARQESLLDIFKRDAAGPTERKRSSRKGSSSLKKAKGVGSAKTKSAAASR